MKESLVQFVVAGCLGCALFLVAVSPAQADLIMELGGVEYSGSGGATLPDNAVRLILEDTLADTVRLTIDGTNLPVATDKLTSIVFNVAPAFTAGSLTFDYDSFVSAKSISFSPDSISGWGDAGKFDIEFKFQPGDFGSGSKSVYDISGSGLDSTDFLFKSVNDENASATQYAAFHLNVTGAVDGRGDTISGKYGTTAVPEPSTLVAWSIFAVIGLFFGRRLRRR